jgi:hypothetical protein
MPLGDMVSLVVRRRVLNQLEKVHYERDLALRIEQGDALYQLRVHPQLADEPVFVRFSGRAGVETSSQVIVGAAEIVVTRLRLILLVKSGMNARGLSQETGEVAIVSVDRRDLGPPRRATTRSGKIKRVEFPGSEDSFVILVPYLRNFESFLKVMAPEYVAQLGYERAAEIEDRRLDDELEAMLLEYERDALGASEVDQKQTATDSARRPSSGVAVGVKLINRLMSSIPGRLSIVAACAFAGTVLILSGNYVQSYYAVEQARCSRLLSQPISCPLGDLATTIGSGLSKTGWVTLFSPIIIVVTAVIIVRKRRRRERKRA